MLQKLGIHNWYFPGMMIAKVIPIHKTGAKNNFDNHRRILLFSQFSKILEKLFDYRF